MNEDHALALVKPAASSMDRRQAELVALGTEWEPAKEADLRSYWRVLDKRRWTVLSVLTVVLTVALIATLKETPIYRGRTLLEIEKENPEILTVQDLFELENVSDNYLMTQYKILESESLARRVISELHLDRVGEFNPPPRWWRRQLGVGSPAVQAVSVGSAVSPSPETEEITLKNFQRALDVSPVRQSRLVEVSFESENPVRAAQIANTLASNYVDQNLELRWDATQKATGWLSQQLGDLKIKLEKSEDDLQHYAQSNGLVFLENEQGKPENIVDERLRQLQDELTKAQADRYAKEPLYQLVQAGDYASLPGVVENKLMQDLTLRLADLDNSYAQLSATFSPDYPKLKQLKHQIDDIQATLDRERQRVAERITNDYTASVQRQELVEKAFQQQQKQADEVASRTVQYNILKREVDTNKQLYEGLLQRIKEAGVSAGLKASNIRVVDPAVPPVKPVRPRTLLNMSLALLVGLCGGVGAAFLQEHLDNTLKTTQDIERFMRLPALAMIPTFESLNGGRGTYGLLARAKGREKDSGSAPSKLGRVRIDDDSPQYARLGEAFRDLRTSVLLSTANRPPRSLLITSARPSEGKTTVATNLAISLAQLGQRVLLIDADLRRPAAHKVFQVSSEPGLVSYLAGLRDWCEVVVPTTVNGLDIAPAGPVPPNPAELLSSDRMRTFLREAVERYTTVLVDSPPLLNVADSRVLAVEVEGVVLIVRGNATPRELAQRARAYAHNVGANLIGVVLNGLDARTGDYYYYYQRDYYARAREDDEPAKGQDRG